MENKDIINLLYETMKDRDVWFITDIDYTFGKKDCYKLNEYGKLADEKEENKVVKEINNYIGDGAANVQEAINCWLNDAMYNDNSINFTDMLHMDFEDEPIIDGIEASTVDLEKRGGPGIVRSVDITRGPDILTEGYDGEDNTIFVCMDCGEEFELWQTDVIDDDGNPCCPYCGSGDVDLADDILNEDFTDEQDTFITIETGLNDKASKEILDSVIGQLSDGIWENSPAMDKYWSNMDIDRQDGQLVVICKTGYGSGFHGKDANQIREWLANKVKQIVKEEELKWDRNNDTISCYLDRGNGTKVTVQDAYRVYDKLKGRIDRIQPKTEGIHDPVIDEMTTGKWKVTISKRDGESEVVNFYDISQDETRFPGGQYTYSYYLNTLLGKDGYGTPIDQMSAFSLDTGVPAWTIEGEDLQKIASWLREFDSKQTKSESKQIKTESVKQDLIDANVEDLTTEGGEDWIVFYLGDKELASYSFSGTFDGELPETRQMLADENGVNIEDIKVKAITKPLTESEHDLSKDLFGSEADKRQSEADRALEKYLQLAREIKNGENETITLDSAKELLRNAYIKAKCYYSFEPEEIDKRIARDIPDLFGEKQEENFLMDKVTDIAKSNIELGSTVLGGLTSAGLLASEEEKESADKLEEAEEEDIESDVDTNSNIDEEETVDTSVTPEDRLRKRTQDVYNLLTDNGLDVAISTDNGENQVEVVLNDRDGKIIIPVREDNELEPITGGSISLDEDSLKILDQVKDILNSEEV